MTFRLGFPSRLILAALLCGLMATSASAADKPAFRAPTLWESKIREFETRDRQKAPPENAILFVGSSTIVGWNVAKHFPDLVTINRGFGGSYVSESVHFANRIVLPYRPKVIAFYAGDNDIADGKTPEQVVTDYREFVKKVHAALPQTRIVYLAIKPSPARWKHWAKSNKVNRAIAEMVQGDPRLAFVDTATPTLGVDGKPRSELFQADGLHLNERGYVVWSNAVRPCLLDVAQSTGPSPASDLRLAAPIDRWDEAIPLGNGLVGGLLYGNGASLKLSLDRGDLWDLRVPETIKSGPWTHATLKKLVAEKNQAKIVELFDVPYEKFAYPTKIPGGRIEITLGGGPSAKEFSLDLRRALGRVDAGQGRVECFFSAVEPVAMFRIVGAEPKLRIVAPDSLKRLGYKPPKLGQEGSMQWAFQEAALGLNYAVVVASRRNGDTTEIALSLRSTSDGDDPLALGKKCVGAALSAGFDAMQKPHEAWWRDFWAKSGVRLPNAAAQRQYDVVQYFYGASSRRGAPPMPLQGVWSADEGSLPPWHGDYHNDLNTQLTYWAYLTSGRFDEGLSFLDFLWNQLPVYRKFARDFYGAPGAAIPGVMALDGQAMGGWPMYSLSPTNGAWNGFAYYLHWRYTQDRQFLDDRAYPFCAEIGTCLEALLQPDAKGFLKLPLSSSPEIHDNSLKAWLAPNSTYDLAILKAFFGTLVDMARAKQDDAAQTRWQKTLDRLEPFAVDRATGVLKIDEKQMLPYSHRHLSHLIGVYPFRLLNVEQDDAARKTILASLDHFERFGTSQWCGYSFGWFACMTASCGQGDRAWSYLDRYLKGFIARNEFHTNGDFKNLGYSDMKYRPFTLEGNFAASEAVHEMLLQSWGGRIRVFPAMPKAWADASFDRLRAEGAFLVSAVRSAGKTTSVRIEAARAGTLRLRDPFAGRPAQWNRGGVTRNGDDWTVALAPGETLEGRAAD
jgi:alpha-L-fucosidase 2